MHILIIEDDTDINNSTAQYLRRQGCECVQAFSGTEGRLLWQAGGMDLLLVDLMLPGLSGSELIGEIRETSRAPVIVLSAKTELSDKVELLGLEIRDRTAYVDLSSGFNQLVGVGLSMADYCLTLSLTALDSVRAVTVTAQGRPLGQQPKQVFYERDVLLSDMGDVLQTVEVSLYFLNADGALAAEKRMLSLYEGQTLAEALVAALLEGPESRELLRAVPEGFAINYVRVDSGVCYLSLPASSLALLPQDGQTQQMILWSLADSLYSIDSVEEIRLLADGEELKLFGSVPVESVAVRPQG